MPKITRIISLLLALTFLAIATAVYAANSEDLAEAEDWFTFGEYQKALNRTTSLLNENLLKGNDLRDGYVLQARCLVALDREDEAKDAFRQVIRTDPKWQPDPALFTAPEIAAYSEAVSEVLADSSAAGGTQAKVETTPPPTKNASMRKSGFFMGVAVSAIALNGSGNLSELDFDLSDPLLNELQLDYENVTGIGWGLDSKTLFGFKPLLGYRISPQFSIYGTYQYFLEKTSESNNYATGSGEFENVDGDWSQSSIQIFGQFYPGPESRFYLLGGFEFVSATAGYNSTWNWGGGDTGSLTSEFKFSGSGLVLGLGMDIVSNPNGLNLFGAVTYSLANIKEDDVFEGEWEIKAGGVAVELGARFYFTK